MKTLKLIPAFVIFITLVAFPQNEEQLFVVASYNVENLFDTINDPTIDDEQFLPSDSSKWNSEKYSVKLKNLAAVIDSMNNGWGPDILGLIEVENKAVIEDLVARLGSGKKYKIVHYDSPDGRGIDVALIYNSDLFSIARSEALVVELPDKWPTRSILHAVLCDAKGIEFNFYVNHWPSRRGGEKSATARIAAASVLRKSIDKLLEEDPKSKIIMMGDFNDEPLDVSVEQTLRAGLMVCIPGSQLDTAVYNLAMEKKIAGEGTYLYQGNWNMLDQIIVSGSVAASNYLCNSYSIFKPEFILQKNGKYAGSSLPTFGGKRYFGGYSDHFAVYAVFRF